ncbi:hypothetical protein AB9F35_20125 [Rhizobium leguminosarum]|uniref:hypothetical protein n=1 Tax=Rhizobium leguminosarum TaxID=384 RepID=UPI003F96D993
MLRALLNTPMRLCFKAILLLLVIGLKPAAATPKCPPQNELLAKAKVVVQARVKSLSVGESGLLATDGNVPTRMIRVDLEITKVIKGKYPQGSNRVRRRLSPRPIHGTVHDGVDYRPRW